MKCSTKYCRNERAPNRTICHKCRSRLFREKHPEIYFFNALRNNARRRGKEFTLTLGQFKQFCKETGYLQGKGKQRNDMTIDRIDSSKGYSIDNIQILTLSDNSMKDCPF